MSRTDCSHYTDVYGARLRAQFRSLRNYDSVSITISGDRLLIKLNGEVFHDHVMQACCAVEVRRIYEEVYGVPLN